MERRQNGRKRRRERRKERDIKRRCETREREKVRGLCSRNQVDRCMCECPTAVQILELPQQFRYQNCEQRPVDKIQSLRGQQFGSSHTRPSQECNHTQPTLSCNTRHTFWGTVYNVGTHYNAAYTATLRNMVQYGTTRALLLLQHKHTQRVGSRCVCVWCQDGITALALTEQKMCPSSTQLFTQALQHGH